jgi:hypothetical protein
MRFRYAPKEEPIVIARVRWSPLLVLALVVMASLLAARPGLAEPKAMVTMKGLLLEMIDMERLAFPPGVGTTSAQQSSYDRASTSPDKPDTWFANGDAGQFIRKEQTAGRTEWVMSEMEGPGAIVRLWSANPDGGGTIRIYVDDLTKPALEEDFLALTTAKVAGFPAPFSGRRALGANLYFPIPYQTRCKVTVDKPGLYYHVGYRSYPQGTDVEPFSMARARALATAVRKVGDVLADPFAMRDPASSEVSQRVRLGRRSGWTTIRVPGPRAITRIEVTGRLPKENVADLMRGILLRIRWDGEEVPSVYCPLGDFFGSTPGINPFATLGVGMTKDGVLFSNWCMPFRKSAEIELLNEAGEAADLTVRIWSKRIEWPSEGYLRFHAKWRTEWLPEKPPFVDWPMLECDGPGRFVGVMLGVMNTTPAWWGEGDEKIWVDGGKFPSFFGTGSEDYFGYAWCNPELFTHAYHAQSICTGPGNFGYTSVIRLHIFDDVPFQHRYRQYIEKWDTSDREYSSTAYWYAAPGAKDFFVPVSAARRKVKPLPFSRVEGAIEGEDLPITVTAGKVERQGAYPNESNWAQAWWTGAKPGDVLTAKVNVEKPGTYSLTLGMGTAIDYGIHQILWDGQPVGAPFDAYHDGVVFTAHEFGTVKVDRAGEHTLSVKIVGKNDKAVPGYMFGFDYVLLKAVK